MKQSSLILTKLKVLLGVKTYKEVGDMLGVPYKTIGTWQTNGEIPSNRLLEISQKLGVSMETLTNRNIKDNNIVFDGNDNTISQNNNLNIAFAGETIEKDVNLQLLEVEKKRLDEFAELYKKYRTPSIFYYFMSLVDKLEKERDNKNY
ncbi:helix-turn-helix domain-containing protein [Campylobacter sp. 7477a]|uniref:helix-turn-helix domain-containing protein n=1 Tax=Campylobacter sp. 7477a TaxID=2735741 RepID=UPI0030157900|nr:helix-turn-helix domain-containing protein [Campylobacter sp. 7477a]